MEIVEIDQYSDQVLVSLNDLMPQLSAGFGQLKRDDLETIVSSGASRLFMAREHGEYCGALTLVIFRIPSGLRAWIEDVVVSESSRGRGVGELLVKHAVTIAEQAKVKSIDLTSRATRAPAIALYRKLGFVDRETNVFRYQG